jgi:hypothetical protein
VGKFKRLGELISIRQNCPIVIFPWCSLVSYVSIEKIVYFACPFVDIITVEQIKVGQQIKLNTQKHKFS